MRGSPPCTWKSASRRWLSRTSSLWSRSPTTSARVARCRRGAQGVQRHVEAGAELAAGPARAVGVASQPQRNRYRHSVRRERNQDQPGESGRQALAGARTDGPGRGSRPRRAGAENRARPASGFAARTEHAGADPATPERPERGPTGVRKTIEARSAVRGGRDRTGGDRSHAQAAQRGPRARGQLPRETCEVAVDARPGVEGLPRARTAGEIRGVLDRGARRRPIQSSNLRAARRTVYFPEAAGRCEEAVRPIRQAQAPVGGGDDDDGPDQLRAREPRRGPTVVGKSTAD